MDLMKSPEGLVRSHMNFICQRETKKRQTFHVNLLKEYQERQEPVHQLFVRAVQDEEVTEKFFPGSTVQSVRFGAGKVGPRCRTSKSNRIY